MAEFLRSTDHIVTKIEEIITQAKEFVYFMSADFSQMPRLLSNRLWEARKRGAKVILIYGKGELTDEADIISVQDSRISIFCQPHLKTNAYLNEKEAVLSSFGLFSPSKQPGIEFGTYFRKAYAPEVHAELLKEFRSILGRAVKMVVENGKLVSEEELIQTRKEVIPEVSSLDDGAPAILSTKVLTVKEKRDVVLKLFSRENKDCTIKIEDTERLRIVGKGIVLVLSDERVDMVFVYYEAFQSRIEEIKKFIMTKHPELKVWFQYNRINMNLNRESEIASVFFTIRETVAAFKLIG